MASLKKQVNDKIVIPVLQALVLSIFGIFGGILVAKIFEKDLMLFGLSGAFVLSTYWLLHCFNAGKGWTPPARMQMRVSDFSTPFANIEPQPINVRVVSQDRMQGDNYKIKGFEIGILKRVAFFIIYTNGSLSHNFLDLKMGIMKRDEINKLHFRLLESRLVEKKSSGKTSGIKLTSNGVRVFWEWAKQYQPNEIEKQKIGEYVKKYSLKLE